MRRWNFFFQCKNFLTAFSVRSNAKGGGRLWLLLASSVTRLSEISPFGKKYFSIFAYFRTIFVLFSIFSMKLVILGGGAPFGLTFGPFPQISQNLASHTVGERSKEATD
jgi:hypothetical protein